MAVPSGDMLAPGRDTMLQPAVILRRSADCAPSRYGTKINSGRGVVPDYGAAAGGDAKVNVLPAMRPQEASHGKVKAYRDAGPRSAQGGGILYARLRHAQSRRNGLGKRARCLPLRRRDQSRAARLQDARSGR